MRKHHEMVMEELVPKATGREARLEKKKMHAEKRRNREISPGTAHTGEERGLQCGTPLIMTPLKYSAK